MKKLFFLAITLFSLYGVQAQGFGIGLSGGYLSELDGFGGSLDLIYELDEKWGVNGTFTFATADETGFRTKWTILDLNARYKVYDEFYLLAGGEYISANIRELGLGGGNPIGGGAETDTSDFGINAGTGYKYNLADNVNIFAEVKYVFLDQGYVHGKLGILFDL
ncbi:MAG: outer membrane beta-barrel protein [Bacteroidota bacterium]